MDLLDWILGEPAIGEIHSQHQPPQGSGFQTNLMANINKMFLPKKKNLMGDTFCPMLQNFLSPNILTFGTTE